jgi:polysaccharide deacetylase 2 family uncharacterized protein YibQ
MQDDGVRIGLTALVLTPLLFSAPVHAAASAQVTNDGAPVDRAYVGLIIDDLGNSLPEGQRVLRLPGPVAAAILPHTTHSRELALAFQRADREVLLHLPMQPKEHETATPGPGTLELGMSPHELAHMLEYDLSTVPHAIGVNNHMGSLLTEKREPMRHVMQSLRKRGLLFVDSLTTPDSVAAQVAREHQVPTLVRHVFIDNEREPRAIEQQLRALVQAARSRGYALGIGHPYPETLEALERWLPTLAQANIEIVPLSTLLAAERNGTPLWRASLSR